MCTRVGGNFATYQELRASGMTRAQLSANLDADAIARVRRGIYAFPEACDEARVAVAHGGVLGCISAARHRGLWVLDESPVPHVWMRGDRHRYPHEGCNCTEHWDHTAVTDGFGLPSVPRMLRQIRTCCGIEEFFVVLESALRLGQLDTAGMRWLAASTDPAAREALALARHDADSGLESLVRWRLRRYGLRVRTQVSIPAVGQVDLVIGDRLIVETDGKGNHDGPSSRHRDLVRDANAALWGYTSLRFDYAMVVHDWDLVERAILAAVGRGAHLA